jgi:hypothetical protein
MLNKNMRMKKEFILGCLLLGITAFTHAKIIYIPNDYIKIQQGIDHTVNGDTVLVSPGTYFENINFRGKNIVVASQYILDHDLNTINKTIIDGSKAKYKDSASCVVFNSRETQSAILSGFTITNGRGSFIRYPVNNASYLHGGGIAITKASPTIKNNIITNNGFITVNSVLFNGGGIGINNNSNPIIINNLIQFNKASFGAGISQWENSNATIKNNIICFNVGGHIEGGAGIGLDQSKSIIENNTIVYNVAIGIGIYATGGGIAIWNVHPTSSVQTLKNNIFWGNHQVAGKQIALVFGTSDAKVDVNYCDVEGGYTGLGNIDKDPFLTRSNYFLSDNSPCIDAGDNGTTYNDIEDALNTGFAKMPAKGTLRNDIGAYGGPGGCIFSNFSFSGIFAIDSITFGKNNSLGVSKSAQISLVNLSLGKSKIDSIAVMLNKNQLKIISFPSDSLDSMQFDTIKIEWTPLDESQLIDTILIYHNTPNVSNPIKVSVHGKAVIKAKIDELKSEFRCYPNPASNKVSLNNDNESATFCFLYNAEGQLIKTYSLDKGENILNISTFSRGLYLLQIPYSEGVYTQRLFKK